MPFKTFLIFLADLNYFVNSKCCVKNYLVSFPRACRAIDYKLCNDYSCDLIAFYDEMQCLQTICVNTQKNDKYFVKQITMTASIVLIHTSIIAMNSNMKAQPSYVTSRSTIGSQTSTALISGGYQKRKAHPTARRLSITNEI